MTDLKETAHGENADKKPGRRTGKSQMTTMTDPPQASFRLSQLIYDTRYRSYTFQFIALMLPTW